MPYSNRPLLWLLSTIVKQLLLFFADLAPIFANSPTAWMVERLWTRSDKKLCMLWKKNWAINYSLLDSFFFKNDTACFINLVIYGLHLGFMKQICEKHQQPFQKSFLMYFMASTAMRILEKLYHRLSKIDRSVSVNLKPISYIFGIYMACFLYKKYWS